MWSGMVAISASGNFFRAFGCTVQAIALPALAMLIPSASWGQERCAPAAARVISVQGTVELQSAGATTWMAATLDRTLCLGDTVRVSRASRAALVLANDSLLRLDQRTTLVLRGPAEERRSLLELLLGAVYFFSHQPRALAVDTPFVNAAAEGTEFLVRVAEDRAEVVMLDAKAAFERAIALDSAEPLARLGLGLAIIRSGDLEGGRKEIEIAAALDPNDSLIRSYLGKAYFEERRDPLDAEQYAIAKQLDPNDPTPWFYDAIRLQTVNRPVEALRNLERSIELNNNRAVYRSRLLLDEDLAVRQVSLGRIYNNLGFEQLGLNEATKSLSLDPANYSAHRFLADTYAEIPRHEIARASELLQAQLFQPININPVQPSLLLTDFNIVATAGPAEAGFNEFTPLFTRNNAQLTTTGVVGNNDTYGGEGVLTMLYDRTSLSVGGSGFTTDGFRDNNDDKTKLADVYGQVAVTPKLNLQVEYRYRDTDQGDLALEFDPLDPATFSLVQRRDIDQDTLRFGLRASPVPHSDIILSMFYTKRDEHLASPGRFDDDLHEEGPQGEAQYVFRGEGFDAVIGGGYYDIDRDEVIEARTGTRRLDSDRKQVNAYGYTTFALPRPVRWTLGLGYDDFEQAPLEIEEWTPNQRAPRPIAVRQPAGLRPWKASSRRARMPARVIWVGLG
jgi:tetratricopeptide (TPR) repeat protein